MFDVSPRNLIIYEFIAENDDLDWDEKIICSYLLMIQYSCAASFNRHYLCKILRINIGQLDKIFEQLKDKSVIEFVTEDDKNFVKFTKTFAPHLN